MRFPFVGGRNGRCRHVSSSTICEYWLRYEVSLSHFGRFMVDRLEAMTVLLAAVEQGSLSAASRRLGMPLPTVSRKVSELEAHLGTRLVNRTSRRLALT